MKTRETMKKLYISNYVENYNIQLANTIFTEKNCQSWIELSAMNDYDDRKKEINNKADALMYGIIDSKKRTDKIKKDLGW